jgi:hypothetical protein
LTSLVRVFAGKRERKAVVAEEVEMTLQAVPTRVVRRRELMRRRRRSEEGLRTVGPVGRRAVVVLILLVASERWRKGEERERGEVEGASSSFSKLPTLSFLFFSLAQSTRTSSNAVVVLQS